MTAPQMVSIAVAARDYLGISDDLAYKLANSGEFPGHAAMRLGRRWVVSVPKLQRAIHGDAFTLEAQS